jgi:hypothetical protein
MIIALKSRTNVNLTIEFITTKVLHEELKMKDVERPNEGRLVLVVHTSKVTSNNSTTNQKLVIKRDKKKNMCNYCKKLGH